MQPSFSAPVIVAFSNEFFLAFLAFLAFFFTWIFWCCYLRESRFNQYVRLLLATCGLDDLKRNIAVHVLEMSYQRQYLHYASAAAILPVKLPRIKNRRWSIVPCNYIFKKWIAKTKIRNVPETLQRSTSRFIFVKRGQDKSVSSTTYRVLFFYSGKVESVAISIFKK